MNWIQILSAAAAIAALAAVLLVLRRRTSGYPAGAADGSAFPEGKTEKSPAVPGSASATERRGGAGLQGTLAQTPLHDLLQYLSLGRKSGILELVSGRRAGRVVLKEGTVCKNSYRGKEGMEAMFMMMDLPEGDFEFYEQTIEEAPTQSCLEVVDLIMLWMDRKTNKKA